MRNTLHKRFNKKNMKEKGIKDPKTYFIAETKTIK